MTVYVDDMRRRARVGQITANWSHLMADTSEELRAFAQALGLNPEWIQHAGTHREHFDLTDTVRAKALAIGAQPMSYPRETGQYMTERRAAAKAARDAEWHRTDMRGCKPPEQPGGCRRLDLVVYSRIRNGRLQTGHEHAPGEVVPCGARVELKPGEGRRW